MLTREEKIKALRAVSSGFLKPDEAIPQFHLFVACHVSFSHHNGTVYTEAGMQEFKRSVERLNKKRAALDLPTDTIVLIVEQD